MFGGRVGFSFSFAGVGVVLPLIESESVKGGLGFGMGDSCPFFPGEPGGGTRMSFGRFFFPIHPLLLINRRNPKKVASTLAPLKDRMSKSS